MKNDITVAIFGDCGTHEICKEFEHVSAVGLLSWLSLASKRADFANSTSIMNKTTYTDYVKRVLIQDINKTALDYLFKKKADYLVVDLNDNRMSVVRMINEDIYLTKYGYNKDYLPILHQVLRQVYSDQEVPTCYEIIDPVRIDISYFSKAIKNICKKIKGMYNDDEIILHMHFPVRSYLKNGKVEQFESSKTVLSPQVIGLMEKCYDIFLQNIPNCHVIKMPNNVVADSSHPLGLFPFHYHKSYYEYGNKAIQIISKKLPREEEILRLHKLRCEYTNIALYTN